MCQLTDYIFLIGKATKKLFCWGCYITRTSVPISSIRYTSHKDSIQMFSSHQSENVLTPKELWQGCLESVQEIGLCEKISLVVLPLQTELDLPFQKPGVKLVPGVQLAPRFVQEFLDPFIVVLAVADDFLYSSHWPVLYSFFVVVVSQLDRMLWLRPCRVRLVGLNQLGLTYVVIFKWASFGAIFVARQLQTMT